MIMALNNTRIPFRPPIWATLRVSALRPNFTLEPHTKPFKGASQGTEIGEVARLCLTKGSRA